MMAKLLALGLLFAAIGSIFNIGFLLPLGFLVATPAIVWFGLCGGRN